MDDSSPSKPENEHDPPAKDPTLADLIKALRDTERSDDKQTKSQTKSARWSSIATVVIAFFTFVTIGVGVAQWWVLSGTLSEMRAEQRPWVYSVGTALGDPVSIDSNGFRISLLIDVKNVGHLPAMKVFPILSATPMMPTHILTELPGVERKICNQATGVLGATIFPGEKKRFPVATYINHQDFDLWAKKHPALAKRFILPYVIVCISYVDPSGNRHSTPYYFSVMAKKDGRICCALPIDPDDLAKSNVALVEEPDGGMPAD